MSDLDKYTIIKLNGTDNYNYYQHFSDKFWYTKKIYENLWLHYNRKTNKFHEFTDLYSFIIFLQLLHENEKKAYLQEIVKGIKILRSDKMQVNELTKIINETLKKKINLNKNFNIDKDVLNVVAIAIASDILNNYDITKKNRSEV
jgi:hypothetical protein